MGSVPHRSVFLEKAIEFLKVRSDGIYLDATVGAGGHSAAIAGRLTSGTLIGLDRDEAALRIARESLGQFGAVVRLEQEAFSRFAEVLDHLQIDRVDGVLADLGVSSMQLDDPMRGFSFHSEVPLDMRMDRSQGMTAAELINHTAEKQLADLIFESGGERRARKLARAIVRARPIRGTGHLAHVIESVTPRSKSRLHPATKTFLALRLEVNQEITELDALLAALPRLVASGGRVVFLTFHSTEDRKVKYAFRSLAREGRATILTKHVLRPAEAEIRENRPSRSAKLRALELR